MRIGLDAKRAFCNARGLGQYARNLIDGLIEYGSINEYFLYTPPPKLLYMSQPPTQAHVISPRSRFLSSLWRGWGVSFAINKNHLDIFHGLSHEIPHGIVAKKTKTIVTMHDLFYMRHPEWFPKMDRFVYERKYRSSCQRADRIWSVSLQTTRDLQEFFKIPEEKIFTGYQSCHPRFYTRFDPREVQAFLKKRELPSRYILYVGALELRKNLTGLVKAYAAGRSDLGGAKLLLVGRGRTSHMMQLKDLVAQLKLEDDVIFRGDLANHEMPAVYQGALCMAFPSGVEGFGIPIIEALFSKLPVVLQNTEHFRDVAGSGGHYVDVMNAEDFAAGLKKAVTDETFRSQLIQSGYEHVQKFHQKAVSEKLLRFYESLL